MKYIIGSRELIPNDSETIAVLDDPIGITAAKLTPAAGDFTWIPAPYALLTLEDGAVRYQIDGTDPVALVSGHLLNTGDILELHGLTSLTNLRMVRNDGAENPVVQVSLYWPGRRIQ